MGQTPSQPDQFNALSMPPQPTKRVRFRHPVAVFFHVIFKIFALLVYLFGSAFGHEFLGLFVTLVFMISLDFWVVKNVTGRLLAGLRWWNYIDDEGQSHWVFENKAATGTAAGTSASATTPATGDAEFILFSQGGEVDQARREVTGSDATVFWVTLFLFPILWFFFLLSAVFSLNIHWALFVGLALVLSGSNLFGYLRCRFGTNYNYGSVISDYVGPKMFYNMMRSAATAAASSANTSGNVAAATTST